MTDTEKTVAEKPAAEKPVAEKPVAEKAIGEKRKPFRSRDLWQPPRFIGYKICAVLAAIVIWVYVLVAQNQLTDTVFTVPLEIRNLSSELALLETTNQVQVRLQGNNADLNALNSGSITAYLDMEGVQAGSTSLEVKVSRPDGLQLVSVTPNTVDVTLERLATATFPLQVKIIGRQEDNYSLLDAVASPQEISISGAKQYIDNVGSVFVTADVSALTENYSKNLHVQVVDHSGNNISEYFTVEPSTVSVVIPIVYAQPEKNLAVNASVIGEPAEGYQISRIVVEPATVRAFGDLQLLNSIYYLETEPINVTGLKKSYSQSVSVVHNGNITLSASSVTVVVQIEPVSTATYSRDIIYAQNLSSNLACDLPELEVKVTVTGPETYIDAVSANEIIPYVDCSGIVVPGEYTLPLSATLPANVSLVSTDPAQITFTVTAAGL